MKTIKICDCCIEAIKSHGEKLYTGNTEYTAFDSDLFVCEWCNEKTDNVTECHF